MTNKKEDSNEKKWILAIDPGSDKAGYSVVYYDFSHGEMGVVFLSEVHKIFERFCNSSHKPETVVIGNGTASRVLSKLYNNLDFDIPLRFAEEKNTTYKARERFFSENPPTGIWKIVPLGLQTPGVPIDDYAAWLIGERFLKDQNLGKKD